jgi:hypothetical protein
MKLLAVVAVASVLGIAIARGDAAIPGAFTVNATQAKQVTSVVEFLRAYNRARLKPALAVLAAQPSGSDCDYRREKAFAFRGRAATVRWLRARFRDHDRLTLARIYNENPNSGRVVAVEFSRRTSDTLRAMGFRNGVRPRVAAKVVFTPAGRISTFAFGPVGGNPEICRPEPAG